MRFRLLIVLFLVIGEYVNAQKVIWNKTYGGIHSEYLFDAISTPDDGFILAGGSLSGATGNKKEGNYYGVDYSIWKMDRRGKILWQKTFGGNGLDYLKSVSQTFEGGYILGGYSTSGKGEVKTEDGFGAEDLWIIKLNPKGEIEWQRTLGGKQKDILSSIKQTRDGGYIVAASSSSPVDDDEDSFIKNSALYGNLDYWLLKLDREGEIEWEKTYGGMYRDELKEVYESTTGDFILAGSSNSNRSGNKSARNYGQNDIWVIRTNPQGDIIWQQTFGGLDDDIFGDMKIMKEEGEEVIFIGGSTNSSFSGNKTVSNENGTDFWLLKLSEAGDILWQETYNIGAHDILTTIELDQENNAILVGGHAISGKQNLLQKKRGKGLDSYALFYIDTNGEEQWRKTVGSSGKERLQRILINRENEILLTGTSAGAISKEKTSIQGRDDFWVVCLGEKKEEKREKRKSNLEAYPNPTDGFSNVLVLNDFEDGVVNVYDITGRNIQHFNLKDTTAVVDLSAFSAGIYIVEVITDNSKESIKIIKK